MSNSESPELPDYVDRNDPEAVRLYLLTKADDEAWQRQKDREFVSVRDAPADSKRTRLRAPRAPE